MARDRRLIAGWSRGDLAKRWKALRARFEDTADPSESLQPYPYPLKLWFGAGMPRRLFYFTKATFSNFLWQQLQFPDDWLAMERPLIPTRASIAAARHIAAGFQLPIIFLGDLTPMDLTVFALLRHGGSDFWMRGARPLPVHYAGINDEWLSISDKLRLPGRVSPSVRMRPLEREHWELLIRLVPDLATLVGERSFGLLQRGQLVHLEMTLGRAGYRRGLAGRFVRLLSSAADRVNHGG